MAINLKVKKKCHVVAPEWLAIGNQTAVYTLQAFQLQVDYLKDRLEEETTKDGFSKLPFRYIEISKVLLDM